MFRKIDGNLYRVNTTASGFLVECDTKEDLCRFCAMQAARGYAILSVVSINPYNKATPRLSVLTDPAYKKFLRQEFGT